MRQFFRIIIVFFTSALLLLLEQNYIQAQSVDSIGYIQNIKNETVVLVSNNILNSEVFSSEQKNDQNFIGSTPFVLGYQPVESLFNKNTTQLNGSFIHNLSTNKQKVHQIRAP